jgi:hypothetical protein
VNKLRLPETTGSGLPRSLCSYVLAPRAWPAATELDAKRRCCLRVSMRITSRATAWRKAYAFARFALSNSLARLGFVFALTSVLFWEAAVLRRLCGPSTIRLRWPVSRSVRRACFHVHAQSLPSRTPRPAYWALCLREHLCGRVRWFSFRACFSPALLNPRRNPEEARNQRDEPCHTECGYPECARVPSLGDLGWKFLVI